MALRGAGVLAPPRAPPPAGTLGRRGLPLSPRALRRCARPWPLLSEHERGHAPPWGTGPAPLPARALALRSALAAALCELKEGAMPPPPLSSGPGADITHSFKTSVRGSFCPPPPPPFVPPSQGSGEERELRVAAQCVARLESQPSKPIRMRTGIPSPATPMPVPPASMQRPGRRSSLGFAQSFPRKRLWSSHPYWAATMHQLNVECTLVLSILLSGYHPQPAIRRRACTAVSRLPLPNLSPSQRPSQRGPQARRDRSEPSTPTCRSCDATAAAATADGLFCAGFLLTFRQQPQLRLLSLLTAR